MPALHAPRRMNMDLHPKYSVMKPPRRGPIPGPRKM
eukprot:CAMPEP_0167799300 /NCGR_PEP_ID=MMETSP0111_2-20121227/16912_1 /TAXON_ID=91324 /ORGANISM="Lotharella globosa, Strain CCCM811" /LENGTH=35 /DNA_ID= /DNA_START= /DNA_END= /DNA_ORIENTATION=